MNTIPIAAPQPPFWYKSSKIQGAFPRSTSGTVTSGVATFYLTDTDAAGGNALFSTVYMESLTWWINDSTGQYAVGSYTLAANKKSFTLSVTKLTGASTNVLINLLGGLTSVLTGFSNVNAANGTVISVMIWGKQ